MGMLCAAMVFLIACDGGGSGGGSDNPSEEVESCIVGRHNLGHFDSAAAIYILNDYAYAADYEDGLHVIDISNPSAIVIKGGIAIPGSALGVYVEAWKINGPGGGNIHISGSDAYIAAGNLSVIDLERW